MSALEDLKQLNVDGVLDAREFLDAYEKLKGINVQADAPQKLANDAVNGLHGVNILGGFLLYNLGWYQ